MTVPVLEENPLGVVAPPLIDPALAVDPAPAVDTAQPVQGDTSEAAAGDVAGNAAAEAESSGTQSAITAEQFEELVERAIEAIPEQLAEGVENVAFFVEQEPPAGMDVLGLYEGQPLTERLEYSGVLPDTITIYQGPLTRAFPDPEVLAEEVYKTVVHEVGHYFGFEEHDLHRLGWG